MNVLSLALTFCLDIDAWAKPPSRLFVGNIAWLGAYDECKQISDSHYCLANTHVLNIVSFVQCLNFQGKMKNVFNIYTIFFG